MTIKRDYSTGNMIAQCNHCKDAVEFDEGEEFFDVVKAITKDGWKAKKVGYDWEHTCVDCLK